MEFRKAINELKRQDEVNLLSHIDADGISAAAIVSASLDREGIEHRIYFTKQLREELGEGFWILTDLGSGQLDLLANAKGIILDHHQKSGHKTSMVHINSYDMGINGSSEISGAGMAYLFAKSLDKMNVDLAPLAVVGAIGDIQNLWGRLEGKNREIIKDAVDFGLVGIETDLQIYGKETRPIFKSLQYFTDPYVPGVSNSESGSSSLLKELGIKQKVGSGWRCFADLRLEEKQLIGTELIKRALYHTPGPLKKYVPSLIVGEVYKILSEKPRTELRDADEFSTCLNACGRNGRPEVGVAVCKGNRMRDYKTMTRLLKEHRKNIAEGLGFVESEGIKTVKGIQYFDARDQIKETLVGTIAGMVLGGACCDPYKPLFGICQSNGQLKVSGRCSRLLVLDGMNLGKVMRDAAKKVGGRGGGHAPAAGAFIPEGRLNEFLAQLRSRIK